MDNEILDQIMFYFKRLFSDKSSCKKIGFILINDDLMKLFFQRFNLSDFVSTDSIIGKVVTDFYAYELYNEQKEKDISDEVSEIVLDIKQLSSEEDVLNYVKFNPVKFTVIIDEYYRFQSENVNVQQKVIANVVNNLLDSEFVNLYNNFFMTGIYYDEHLIPTSAMIGLKVRDIYYINHDMNAVFKYLDEQSSNGYSLNSFYNYLLSNVYAYIKINGCKNEDDDFFLNLALNNDSILFDDIDLNTKLLIYYFKIYSDIKCIDFKDVRDDLSLDDISVVYNLDSLYTHPDDYMKNAFEFYTIIDSIKNYIINNIDSKIEQGIDFSEIVDWLSSLVDGKITIDFYYDGYVQYDDGILVNKFLKTFILSYFYEFCNYKFDELSSDEMAMYKYVDKNCNFDDCLVLFEDEFDREIILNKFLEYCFCEAKDEFLARQKMVDDGKALKSLYLNPLMLLEYRRNYGLLFPLETSRSTEYGNSIIEIIYNILLFFNNDGKNKILLSDFSELFKYNCLCSFIDLDDVIKFIINNIYLNLVNKKNSNDDEKMFINGIENYNLDLDAIVENDNYFGELLLYFYSLNSERFSDEKLRQMLSKNNHIKTMVLKKYDPFFEEDKHILK